MKRFSFSNLRFRLLLISLFAVIPVLGLILYTDFEQRQLAIYEMEKDAFDFTQIASAEEEQIIRGTRQLLVSLAEVPKVYGFDSASCSSFLADLLKHYQRYANFGVIKPNGDLFCCARPFTGPINLAYRSYFRRVLETHDFAIGDYQINKIISKPTIDFAYPVLDSSGQVQVILVAALDLDWLNQHEFAITKVLPKDSIYTKFDAHGVILARHPYSAKLSGGLIPEPAVLKAAIAQGQGVVETLDPDGIIRVHAFATTPSSKLYLGNIYITLSIPKSSAFAAANRLLARNLIMLGLAGALAFAAFWFSVGTFILHPIRMLLQATKKLGNGDLSVRTGFPDRKGEINQLGCAFDQMAESLTKHEIGRKQAEDILQESEKKYRDIFETSKDVIYISSKDGFLTQISQVLLRKGSYFIKFNQ